MSNASARRWTQLLNASQPEHATRAAGPQITSLAQSLAEQPQSSDARTLLAVLIDTCQELDRAHERAELVRTTLEAAHQLGRPRAALREMVREVARPRAWASDRGALGRWMDEEALLDRLLRHLHRESQRVEILCRAAADHNYDDVEDLILAQARSALARIARDPDERWTVREQAIRAAGPCCTGVGDEQVRATIRTLATDATQDPWVRAAALRVLCHTSHDSPAPLLEAALDPNVPSPHADHLFFVARTVELAADLGRWELVVRVTRRATSEHILQACTSALARSPRVSDHALLRAHAAHGSPAVAGWACAAALSSQNTELGLDTTRAALQATEDIAQIAARTLNDRLDPSLTPEQAAHMLAHLGPSLERWSHDASADPDLRVDTAAISRALTVAQDPELAEAWRTLTEWAQTAQVGARIHLSAPTSMDRVSTVLTLVAQHTRDLCATPRRGGWTIQYGAKPRSTVWRAVHEMLHPRPDKRQAWSHTVDYVPTARLIAPARGMAEVTPTAVPGRPVCTPSKQWWSPDLPLPAWLITAARSGPLRIEALPDVRYTIKATSARARWRAHSRYVHLARARSAAVEHGRTETYDKDLSNAGFSIHRATTIPFLGLTMPDLFSLDGNTLTQLGVFSTALALGWIGNAAWAQQRVRSARKAIPLVIGGWGSRGKSGTERLKAAIFHDLGYTVLSKTTGNEAMFVVGLPGREPVEIFLYRPYDRASIVEQRDVVHLAKRMGAQVLLWECMALNPRYVSILQHDWMRDDITTITNTYPDHEDIQGPSGLDVAHTISTVLPKRATAFTTEQAMAPVLRERAHAVGTALHDVRAETWSTLPADLMQRFPYQEHPRNIALILDLAESMDVRRDVALRAMADRIVPDLGVLKEYGPSMIDGRSLSFVVGNSANERAGFLSNWHRMGFHTILNAAGLDDVTALVVNNRKDRLPRQEVFARVAALDAPVDHLVVIGTNIGPFMDAWRRIVRTDLRARLIHTDRDELVAALARRLRRPAIGAHETILELQRSQPSIQPQAVHAIFAHAAPDRPPPPPTVAADPVSHALEWTAQVAWLRSLNEDPDFDVHAAVDAVIELVLARVHGIQDSAASGDTISAIIAGHAAPGSRVRALGAANIKGTGLDLVYRWVQLDKVRTLLHVIGGDSVARASEALRTLRALSLGRLDRDQVSTGLQELLPALHDPGLRVSAESLLRELHSDTYERTRRRKGWFVRTLKGNIDLDSVRRRQQADQLYSDLAKGQVGLSRAAQVAQQIVKRQKI